MKYFSLVTEEGKSEFESVEDFVTAEFQNYGSSFNSLTMESFKINRYHHDFYSSTESSTSTTQGPIEKSILNDFLR